MDDSKCGKYFLTKFYIFAQSTMMYLRIKIEQISQSLHRCVARMHANCHKLKLGLKFFKEVFIIFFTIFCSTFEKFFFNKKHFENMIFFHVIITNHFYQKVVFLIYLAVTVERTIELLEKQIDTQIRFVGNPKKPSRRNSFLILTTTECLMNIEF